MLLRIRPYDYIQTEQHYFYYETYDKDFNVIPKELFTTVEKTWKVHPGSYSYDAPSDLDYYGYRELVAAEVISTVDEEDNEVDPLDVLTDADYTRYTKSLRDFIGDFL